MAPSLRRAANLGCGGGSGATGAPTIVPRRRPASRWQRRSTAAATSGGPTQPTPQQRVSRVVQRSVPAADGGPYIPRHCAVPPSLPLSLSQRFVLVPPHSPQDAASLDVSGAVVQPAYRSTPWEQGAEGATAGPRAPAKVALVSESGICRGPLAAAALAAALHRRGLGGQVECECRATQSYCVGEGAHPAAGAAAAELGLELPQGYAAQQFKEARDIVEYDVVR